MSLDKGIQYGKERRREYHGSKRFDRSCRHGGNCDYCRNGRQYHNRWRELSAKERLDEYKWGVEQYDWPHLLAARKADFQSVNRGSIPRGVIMNERRELTNGYYAIKWKGDREWLLYQENSHKLIKSARTLQELRDFLEIRKLWRG